MLIYLSTFLGSYSLFSIQEILLAKSHGVFLLYFLPGILRFSLGT